MNCRERVLAALNLQKVNRIPWIEIGFHDKVASLIIGEEVVGDGSGFHPLDDIDEYEHYIKQMIRLANTIGLDALSLKAWTPNFAMVPVNGQRKLGLTDEMQLRKFISWAPAPEDETQPVFKCAQIFDRIMKKEDLARFFQVGCIFELGRASFGVEDLCIAFYESPSELKKLFSFAGEYASRMIKFLLNNFEADFILLADDIAFKTSLFISPKLFQEFILPQYKKISETVKKFGIPLAYHSDGNILAIYDDLIETGINAIHPHEPLAMDIFHIKKKYGGKVCLMGNLDVALIEKGDNDNVVNQTTELIRRLRNRGYIFSSGNTITEKALVDNVLAISRILRNQ